MSSKLPWERSWTDVIEDGEEGLPLDIFIQRLSRESNQLDRGFSSLLTLLESGLQCIDMTGSLVDSTKLINSCRKARGMYEEFECSTLPEADWSPLFVDKKSGRVLVEKSVSIEASTEFGAAFPTQYGEVWEDWLPADERSYFITRAEVARVFGVLGGETFPWINLEGRDNLLPVAQFIKQTAIQKLDPQKTGEEHQSKADFVLLTEAQASTADSAEQPKTEEPQPPADAQPGALERNGGKSKVNITSNDYWSRVIAKVAKCFSGLPSQDELWTELVKYQTPDGESVYEKNEEGEKKDKATITHKLPGGMIKSLTFGAFRGRYRSYSLMRKSEQQED